MSGEQLVHSNFLQCLVSLVLNLNLESVLSYQPSLPQVGCGLEGPTVASEWNWLHVYCTAMRVAESLSNRTPFPSSFVIPSIERASNDDKRDPYVSYLVSLCTETSVCENVFDFRESTDRGFFFNYRAIPSGI